MECCCHQFSLAHQYWVTLAAGEDFDLRAGLRDTGRSDENHLQWIAGQGSRRNEDGRVDLAAVSVAFDHCIEQAEGFLGGVSDLAGQEDASSAGAEDGVAGGVVAQAVEEVASFQEFENGGGFAAGENEAVQRVQFLGVADLNRLGARFGEGGGVGGVVALDGEDANAGTGQRGHSESLRRESGM